MERKRMKPIKILHCSDLHLGAELITLGEIAKERRQELLTNFFRIVSLCKEEDIELLLIAGDLFEGFNTDKNTIKSVKEALGTIPGTIVAISPGNHDFIAIDSTYSDSDWPNNVHIFTKGLESIEFEDKNLCLWGAAFRSTYVKRPMLLPSGVDEGRINICVIHGEVVSEGQESNYHPITPMQIRFSGMDYIALGHIHKRTDILKCGSTWYSYSGCPEGKGFDETDQKGVYLGCISKGAADLSFRPICLRLNIEKPIDITNAKSDNEVAQIIRYKLRSDYGTSLSENLYRIILEGSTDENYNPDPLAVAARLQDELYYIKISDHSHTAYNLNELSKENSLKGIFVRKMVEKLNSCLTENNDKEAAKIRNAMNIGIKAFDSEVYLNDY
jgi:exonuclease SbcD